MKIPTSKITFGDAVERIEALLPEGDVTVQTKFHLGRKPGKPDRVGLEFTAIHNGRGTRVFTTPTLEALVEKVSKSAGAPSESSASKPLKDAPGAAVEPNRKELDQIKADDVARAKIEEEIGAKLVEAAEKKAKGK